MAKLNVILIAIAVVMFAFAGVYASLGYSGNEVIAYHYMTEGRWSESSCEGCHFMVYDHVATSSHVQRDINEWSPLTNFDVDAEGNDAWVEKFGQYHPGGGVMEEYGVEIDCMICHEQYGLYDAEKRAAAIQSGNMETANNAALVDGRSVIQKDPIHIGTYLLDVLTPYPLLVVFHDSVNGAPDSSSCYTNCHSGDAITTAVMWGEEDYAAYDVHAEVNCVECHVSEGHNIAGSMPAPGEAKAVDHEGIHGEIVHMRSCTDSSCHEGISHGGVVDAHLESITCESCHIPALSGGELAGGTPIESFDWSSGVREDSLRTSDFTPVLEWSNGMSSGELQIIDGKDDIDVKLAPFNVITGIWWDAGEDADVVEFPNTSRSIGDPIPVSYVQDADVDLDGEVTYNEMRGYDGNNDGAADYPDAVLRHVDLYYRLGHNIAGSEVGMADPLMCDDCHGASSTTSLHNVHFKVLPDCETCHQTTPPVNWAALGYDSDPATTNPATDFSTKTIDVTIPGEKPPEVERESAL
ncbi:MAG: methanogenesis multiheme c-type cytochrome [Methanosarcinaceae archaeon]|nr:methanogenesis multiheme c-type cytochrome [Methanosarcinaceae archaeon]